MRDEFILAREIIGLYKQGLIYTNNTGKEWELKTKRLFIAVVLGNFLFHEFCIKLIKVELDENGDRPYMYIEKDSKERIKALVDFYDNKFSLDYEDEGIKTKLRLQTSFDEFEENVIESEDFNKKLEKMKEKKEFIFEDLPIKLQRKFLDCEYKVVYLEKNNRKNLL